MPFEDIIKVNELSVNKLKTLDWDIIDKFVDKHNGLYKKDKRGLNTLNKLMDTNFKHLFREELFKVHNHTQLKGPDINLDNQHIILVTSKNKLITLWNSEWGGICLIGKDKNKQ